MDGVVLVGNPPFMPTGYGKQLNYIGQYLKNHYKVLHVSDFGYDLNSFQFNGVEVAPIESKPGNLTNHYLKATIDSWLERENIDRWVLIALGDLHKWGELFAGFPSAVIAPIDCGEISEKEMQTLQQSIPVAMSVYGQRVLVKHGFHGAFYLHHVAEKSKSRRSKQAIRSTKHWKIPPGNFTVGIWGDFTVRKSPHEMMEAWNEFSMKKKDVSLWIHHSNHRQMVPAMDGWFDAHITTTAGNWTDERLLENLSALDALLHCSNQEGFGVLQIEAQLNGVPVINTDFGPMPELNMIPAMVVPKEGTRDGRYGLPDKAAILMRLESLYARWKDNQPQPINEKIKKYTPGQTFPKHRDPLLDYMFKHFYPKPLLVRPRKPKHIGIISTFGVDCGIATYTSMLSNSLLALGYQVTVFSEEGAEIEIGDNVVASWDRRFYSGERLLDAIDVVNPDIIHVQHESTLFRAFGDLYESLRKRDLHIITTLHTPDFSNPSVMEACLMSDGIILHDERNANQLAGSVMAPVEHIPHGVLHIAPNPDARKEIGLPSGIPMLFHYGFPSHSKGTLDFLKAVQRVKENSPYFEVAIFAGENAGGSPNAYKQECHALAEQIDGVFYSTEFASEDKLNQFLNASSVVVFPYAGAGVNSTSGALMRSLSAGKPIIATDEGRLRDIIGGVHGWKCNAGNVASLEEAIREAIHVVSNDKPLYERMSRRVKEMAVENDWNTVAAKHHAVYNKVGAAWAIHHHSSLQPRPNGKAPLLREQTEPTSSDQEEE